VRLQRWLHADDPGPVWLSPSSLCTDHISCVPRHLGVLASQFLSFFKDGKFKPALIQKTIHYIQVQDSIKSSIISPKPRPYRALNATAAPKMTRVKPNHGPLPPPPAPTALLPDQSSILSNSPEPELVAILVVASFLQPRHQILALTDVEKSELVTTLNHHFNSIASHANTTSDREFS
jgi:hypothetical protein